MCFSTLSESIAVETFDSVSRCQNCSSFSTLSESIAVETSLKSMVIGLRLGFSTLSESIAVENSQVPPLSEMVEFQHSQ